MPRDAGFLGALPRLSSIAAAPRESRAMPAYDATLAWAALMLLALGLVMVYSASIATAEALAYTGYRPWYFLVRHAAFVAVGLLAALFAFQIPLKIWQKLARYLFIAGTALLISGGLAGLAGGDTWSEALALAPDRDVVLDDTATDALLQAMGDAGERTNAPAVQAACCAASSRAGAHAAPRRALRRSVRDRPAGARGRSASRPATGARRSTP